MTSDRESQSWEDNGNVPDELDRAVGDYLDALNSGETLDPKQILAENPRLGHKIL